MILPALLLAGATCRGLTLTNGRAGPGKWKDSNQCDIVSWQDASGHNRTGYLVQARGCSDTNYTGGFLTRFLYRDDAGAWVQNDQIADGTLDGFGHIVNHYTPPPGSRGWINSKTDAFNASNTLVFKGPHHAIWRVTFDEPALETDPAQGQWRTTLDWHFRTGCDAFLYAVTFDGTGLEPGILDHDARGPYSMWDWNDDNSTFGKYGGFEWGRDFKFICTNQQQGAWTYTTPNTVPYVWEWDTNKAREIGFVQTQSQVQRAGGKTPSHGTSGTNLPYYTEMGYQMNGPGMNPHTYEGITWGTPLGAIDGGDGSGSPEPYLNYSLAIVLDPLARGGVTNALAEQERIHDGSVRLIASDGAVITQGMDGAGCQLAVAYDPPGYNHVYWTWDIEASMTNTAQWSLDVTNGALWNPTFVIREYRGSAPPLVVTRGGTSLVADAGYYASVDDPGNRLWLTVPGVFAGSNVLRVAGPHQPDVPGVPIGLAAGNGAHGTNTVMWRDQHAVTGETYQLYHAATVITNLAEGALLTSGVPAGVEWFAHEVTSSGDHHYALVAESEYRVLNSTLVPGQNATTNPAPNNDVTAPATPGNFRVRQRNNQATLSWAAVGAPDRAGYRIYRGFESGSLSLYAVVTNGVSFTNRNLAPNLVYYFQVAAADDEAPPNVSAPSPELCVTSAPMTNVVVYDGEPGSKPLIADQTGAWLETNTAWIAETNRAPHAGIRHLEITIVTNGQVWYGWNEGWVDSDVRGYYAFNFYLRLTNDSWNNLRLQFSRAALTRSSIVYITNYLAHPATNYQLVSIPLSAWKETNSLADYSFGAVSQFLFTDSGSNRVTCWMDDMLFTADNPSSTNGPVVNSAATQPAALNESNDVSEILLLASVTDRLDDIEVVLANLSAAGRSSSTIIKDDGISDDGAADNGVYGCRFSLSAGAAALPGDKALTVTALDAESASGSGYATVTVRRVTFPAPILLYDGEPGSRQLTNGAVWASKAQGLETNWAPYEGLNHMVCVYTHSWGEVGFAFNRAWSNINASALDSLELHARTAGAVTNRPYVYFGRLGATNRSTAVFLAPAYGPVPATQYQAYVVPFTAFQETNGSGAFDFGAVSQIILGNDVGLVTSRQAYVDNIRFLYWQPDSDGDGLSDIRETGDGLYINGYSTGTSSNSTDTDGDGMADGPEVWAGTDPNASGDWFRVSSVGLAGSQLQLGFGARSGRVYGIFSAGAPSGSWTSAGAVTGAGGSAAWSEPATNGSGFYRLLTAPP
ncbi:MAG TPA: hypothetical protein P5567_11360 [Kiritimatiellia bacterium]|nr:hypothetical protein [Kiritimatiellia bacterium]HRZ13037.1 hypothetical protein [Kiritimatiellia bacterium]HSA18353.1 hypothetical protein [Kiritimatiellia bacterium]